ncbi:hypothetical protein [Halobacillus amylolyticus]|uniref:Uncharacterized protein n=1 Tax=Halobacillus amylolyticus TaxID=2932259 RepID=A0ABY4HBE9_9BACI|nr:hypothetical protein [Halobacillus amylolyticus]UOR12002.1 hypothetical protein MUO15_00195 [Halobacillus amylolyticus]
MPQSYTATLLRNLEITHDLKPFLRVDMHDFNRKYEEITGDNGWQKMQNLVNQEIEQGRYEDSNLDEFIFNRLVFDKQDHTYVINLESDIDEDELMERYSDSPAFNRKVAQTIASDEKVISIRQNGNSVVILYKYESVYLGQTEDKANFYTPIILDFDKNSVRIKLRKHYLSRANTNLKGILTHLSHFLNTLDADVSISRYNEATIHSDILYQLYSEESQHAEEVIKANLGGLTETQLNTKIMEFLENDLEIHNPSHYVDRVTAAFYQDRAMHLPDHLFYEGFIFGFTFFDRQITKSSTRNSNKDPIYKTKLYWNLKDLIHEYEEVSEVSMYWRFNENDFDETPEGEDFSFVEVSIREKYGCLEIHYYNAKERRVKEEYVLHRIKEYI